MLLEIVDYNNTNLIINSIIEYITQNKQKNIGVSLRMTCIDTINEKYILGLYADLIKILFFMNH